MPTRTIRARTPLYALTQAGTAEPNRLLARVRAGHAVEIVEPTPECVEEPSEGVGSPRVDDEGIDIVEPYLEVFLTPEAAIDFRVKQIVAEGKNGTDPTPSAIDDLLSALVCIYTLDTEFVVERLADPDHRTSSLPRLRRALKPVGVMFSPGPTGDDRQARLLLRLAATGSPTSCWSSPFGANWSRHAELRLADDRFLPLLVDRLTGVRVR